MSTFAAQIKKKATEDVEHFIAEKDRCTAEGASPCVCVCVCVVAVVAAIVAACGRPRVPALGFFTVHVCVSLLFTHARWLGTDDEVDTDKHLPWELHDRRLTQYEPEVKELVLKLSKVCTKLRSTAVAVVFTTPWLRCPPPQPQDDDTFSSDPPDGVDFTFDFEVRRRRWPSVCVRACVRVRA